jgi:hypothetical protein
MPSVVQVHFSTHKYIHVLVCIYVSECWNNIISIFESFENARTMPKLNKTKRVANFGGVKGGRAKSIIIPEIPQNIDDLDTNMDFSQSISTDIDPRTNNDSDFPIMTTMTQDTDNDSDFSLKKIYGSSELTVRKSRPRVVSDFINPVFAYDQSRRNYVEVVEFDEVKHGPYTELHQNFTVLWIDTVNLETYHNEYHNNSELDHGIYVQSSVSTTKSNDIYNTACALAQSRRLTPHEFHHRLVRGERPIHFVGCSSIVEFAEAGHSLLPHTAFGLPLRSTSYKISVNIELYVRQLMDAVRSREGVMASSFLEGCEHEIQSALWATLPQWPNPNQQSFRYD